MRPLGSVRPGMPAPSPGERPHAVYKAELRERLSRLAPRSVLDVGCGDGALLASLRERGCERCIGLEVDPHLRADLRARGIEALDGAGERIPLPDRSIDVVVMEYAAHHLADLPAALREAARVARRAVLVLDPWYDLSVASQIVASDYDVWCKAIDRRLGLIHNLCPSAGELAAPFQALGGYDIDVGYRLILRPLPPERVSADGEAHLDRLSGERAREAAELARILERARREGVSDDGAVLFTASAA